jgi:hypothetical protein
MSNNANIKSMLETVERIFEAAQVVIEGMADGNRIQIKELAQQVALAVAMEPKNVLGFVHHFAHNTGVAYVTRGKHGGIIKGTRPAKTDKPKKVKKVDVVDTSDVPAAV